MNKKYIALLLCLLLAVSLTGCGKKDPLERLEVAFDNSTKMESATETFDMQLFLSSSEDDPEFAMIENMLNGMKITGKIDVNQKDMSFAGKMKMEMNGMSYEMELYRGEEYFIKMPLFDKYIVIADKESAGEIFNTEMIEGLNKGVMDIMFSKLSSANIIVKDDMTIEQEGNKVKVTPVAIILSDEEAKAMFSEVMNYIFSSEEFREQMQNNMKVQMEALDNEMTAEEIENNYQMAMSEMEDVFKKLNQGISIEKFDAVYYLDENDNIRKNDMDYIMNLDLAALSGMNTPENQENQNEASGYISEEIKMPVLTIQIKGSSDVTNINENIEFMIPELTIENSVGIEGLMGLPVK